MFDRYDFSLDFLHELSIDGQKKTDENGDEVDANGNKVNTGDEPGRDYTQDDPNVNPQDTPPEDNATNTDTTTDDDTPNDYTQDDQPDDTAGGNEPTQTDTGTTDTAPEADPPANDYTQDDTADTADDTPATDYTQDDQATDDTATDTGDDAPANDYTQDDTEGGGDTTGDQTDVEGGDDAATDYTQDDGGGEGDTGDTTGDDQGTDDQNTEGDTAQPTSVLVNNIKDLEAQLFSNLTPEQISIKNIELKTKFIDMHEMVQKILTRIDNLKKTEENLHTLDFVIKKLTELAEMLNDYITRTYDTNSYIENQVNYKTFLVTLEIVTKILDQVKGITKSDLERLGLDKKK